MEKYLKLISCCAVLISSNLLTAAAFSDNNSIIGISALLLSNFACFIIGLIITED
jgi:hypothetical protein